MHVPREDSSIHTTNLFISDGLLLSYKDAANQALLELIAFWAVEHIYGHSWQTVHGREKVMRGKQHADVPSGRIDLAHLIHCELALYKFSL